MEETKGYPVKVSVVLPTYNQCRYLPNAIQTIINQTGFSNFELIIVNDGSTDDTAKYLASINHPKIQIVTQENQGLPNALNSGFSKARGEYWTWTSTDNVVGPTWLEELVKALDSSSPEVGYAFSNYAGMDDNSNILFVNKDVRFDLPSLLLRHSGNASFLYRASLAKKVGPYDATLAYAEDLDMWIRMAEETKAVHIDSILYYYRVHGDSMTAQTEKVRAATRGVVDKFLAKNGGLFDIDKLFPSIQLSADPAFERWKARIWLATLGARAHYYCPVLAIVDQLYKALLEHYDRGVLANIVHLLAKENLWEVAGQTVAIYQQKDNADLLKQLADIIARQAKSELDQIPYAMIDEKLLAADCNSSLTQTQLLRNLAPLSTQPISPIAQNQPQPQFQSSSQPDTATISCETLAATLLSKIEDQQDHPDVWTALTASQTPEHEKLLHHLRLYVSALIQVPQNAKVLLLLQVLEAVCLAYTKQTELAKSRLQQLSIQSPNIPLVMGALNFINRDVRFLEAPVIFGA